jgi:pentatricopeptide repeat protein
MSNSSRMVSEIFRRRFTSSSSTSTVSSTSVVKDTEYDDCHQKGRRNSHNAIVGKRFDNIRVSNNTWVRRRQRTSSSMALSSWPSSSSPSPHVLSVPDPTSSFQPNHILRSFSAAAATATNNIDNNIATSTLTSTVVNENIHIDPNELSVLIAELDKASSFNQGGTSSSNNTEETISSGRSSRDRRWNTEFVRDVVNRYEFYLEQIYNQQQVHVQKHNELVDDKLKELFLSSHTTRHAVIALTRCKLPTHVLSRRIRRWEYLIGHMGKTQMTDALSLALLETHGKSGNVGRAIQLLELRKSRNYRPTTSEFIYAVTSINAAGLTLRKNRNVFLSEKDQPSIDDPTRWLDSILLNMNQRGYELSTPLANRMINTYACTGRSAKSYHFFYKVTRQPVDDMDVDDDYDVDTLEDDNHHDGVDDNDDDDLSNKSSTTSSTTSSMPTQWGKPVKVQLNMRPPPPYHKIPSQVRGKLVRKPGSSAATNNGNIKQLKLDRESDPDWSPALTSAISFADSLKQGGACGHDPIELDLISYTTLMKACVYRGSLWRAMHILDEIMPKEGIKPDIVAYNVLLDGLARVGDVPTSKEYFRQLLSNGLQPTKQTVQAITDGMLNLGDVGTSITFVQDAFNQYSVLPPYTTHLKIIEFALGRNLVYEAKRHVFFIQQLWKWTPNLKYHSPEFCKIMELTQKNPKISRPALEKLFAYFGEELTDSDFLL